ncbi:hypothetical protein HMPREF3036_01108 [Sutterella sp. KLE1602]|nr:hypothetical protein HMPREF3036_01108 [Sutterella sp. KLE1602]
MNGTECPKSAQDGRWRFQSIKNPMESILRDRILNEKMTVS